MLKRKLKIVASLSVLLLITIQALRYFAPEPAIAPAWLAQLKPGMALDDVEALMKADPTSRSGCWYTHELHAWHKQGVTVFLQYSRGRLVSTKLLSEEPTPSQRLQRLYFKE